MNASVVTIQSRASLFIPRFINYSEENKNKYLSLLDNPKIETLEGFLPTVQKEEAPWSICSGYYRLVFLPNRVDVISTEISDNEKLGEEFIEFVNKCFRTIIANENVNAERLAYAPSLAIDSNEGIDMNTFFNSFLQSPQFNNCNPHRTNVKFDYLITENIDNKTIPINYIIKFTTGEKKEEKDGKLETSKVIIVDIDINAKSSDNLKLDNLFIITFFKSRINQAKEFLKVFLPK